MKMLEINIDESEMKKTKKQMEEIMWKKIFERKTSIEQMRVMAKGNGKSSRRLESPYS